jgi:hypothetical protein
MINEHVPFRGQNMNTGDTALPRHLLTRSSGWLVVPSKRRPLFWQPPFPCCGSPLGEPSSGPPTPLKLARRLGSVNVPYRMAQKKVSFAFAILRILELGHSAPKIVTIALEHCI